MLLLLYIEALFFCYFTWSSLNLCLNLIRMFCLYIYMVNSQINCNKYVKINK